MRCEVKNIDDVMNVCRLCLGKEHLISVFDHRIKIQQNIIEVIQITSGVTISANDNVSHKLCNKCLHITIKMFKFRSSSLVNDMELKACGGCKLQTCVNKSVDNILKKYPEIKLPSSISECDLSPVVVINKNEVHCWSEELKKKKREQKKRRKEARAAKKLYENSVQTAEDSLHCVNSSLEVQNRLVKAPIYIPPTPQLLTPQASPLIPVIDEVNEDTQQSVKEVSSSDVQLLVTNNLDEKNKRLSPVQLDCPKPKKLKTNSNHDEIENTVDSLVTVKYVYKSLLICDICNGILYSAKDLKKHKIDHMRCSLCRRVFKSMKETIEHSEGGCSIKKIMNNLPTIKLNRCDGSKDLLQKFPNAFGIKSDKIIQIGIEEPDLPKEPEKRNEEVVEESPIVKPICSTSKPDSEPTEILLISDDEDEENPPVTSNNYSVKIQTDGQTSKKEIPNATCDSVTATTKKITSKTILEDKTNSSTVELNSTNSITPNIEIAGENIFDVNLLDNDTVLLKNLLRKAKSSSKEAAVQTAMPCNADISPNLTKDKLFTLANLRDYLYFYKIPINISYSSQYSVRYSNDPSPLLKKDRSWSKVNTKISSNPIPCNISKVIQNNSAIPPVAYNVSTPMTMSSTQNIPAMVPNSVRRDAPQSGTAVSNSNYPIGLDYNFQNANTPYIMPKNHLLTKPVSSHATVNNANRTFNPNNNHYAATTTIPPTSFSNMTSSAIINMPVVTDGIASSRKVNYSNIPSMTSSLLSNMLTGASSLPSPLIVNASGSMNSSTRVNMLNTASSIPCSTKNNMNTVPSGMPSETRVNIMSPCNKSFQIGNNMAISSATNNMPAPSCSFLPHRTNLSNSFASSITQIVAPTRSNNVGQHLNWMHNAPTSNFKQKIRVRNVAELK